MSIKEEREEVFQWFSKIAKEFNSDPIHKKKEWVLVISGSRQFNLSHWYSDIDCAVVVPDETTKEDMEEARNRFSNIVLKMVGGKIVGKFKTKAGLLLCPIKVPIKLKICQQTEIKLDMTIRKRSIHNKITLSTQKYLDKEMPFDYQKENYVVSVANAYEKYLRSGDDAEYMKLKSWQKKYILLS